MGSMNLDHLINHVFCSQSNLPTATLQQHAAADGRLSTKKTVDEVWTHIQRGQQQLFNSHCEGEGEVEVEVEDKKPNQDRQPTLGEITLEDFLINAGVVCEATPPVEGFRGEGEMKPFIGGSTKLFHSIFSESQPQPQPPQGHCLPYPSQHHSLSQQSNLMPSAFPAPLMSASFGEIPLPISSSTITTLSDAQLPGGNPIAPLIDVPDKSVERRHKRMIKNRESAARSRARKQAYTNELENKVSRLEIENSKLRREREFDCVPLPDPKYQLRRTSSEFHMTELELNSGSSFFLDQCRYFIC